MFPQPDTSERSNEFDMSLLRASGGQVAIARGGPFESFFPEKVREALGNFDPEALRTALKELPEPEALSILAKPEELGIVPKREVASRFPAAVVKAIEERNEQALRQAMAELPEVEAKVITQRLVDTGIIQLPPDL